MQLSDPCANCGAGGRSRRCWLAAMCDNSRRRHTLQAPAILLACLVLTASASLAAAEMFECGQAEVPLAVKKEVQQEVETRIATSRIAFSSVTVPVYYHVISQVKAAAAGPPSAAVRPLLFSSTCTHGGPVRMVQTCLLLLLRRGQTQSMMGMFLTRK